MPLRIILFSYIGLCLISPLTAITAYTYVWLKGLVSVCVCVSFVIFERVRANTDAIDVGVVTGPNQGSEQIC